MKDYHIIIINTNAIVLIGTKSWDVNTAIPKATAPVAECVKKKRPEACVCCATCCVREKAIFLPK